jgi:hypothetical protein
VARGQKLAEWDPFTLPIITERSGAVEYADLIDGVNFFEETDSVTGLSSRVVREPVERAKNVNLRPRVLLRGGANEGVTQYFLQPASVLNVEAGATVHAGDVIARLPRESSKTRDITGGLPRVAELFEARRPKDHAIISDVDGRVEFGKDYKAKRRVLVVPEQVGDEQPTPREYLVPKGKHVSVQEGDYVKAGDPLVDGPRVPHDILRVLGVEALANYLVNEIQDVYRLQGVKINDKHIEVIVRQMLQKVEILDPGDTTFLIGEQVDRIEFDIENDKRLEAKERPARAEPVLQGHHQGELADQFVHLGGLVPGDHEGAHRGRRVGQGGHARGAQGKRHRWAFDPGRDGFGDEPPAGARRSARPRAPACGATGLAGPGREAASGRVAREQEEGGPGAMRARPASFSPVSRLTRRLPTSRCPPSVEPALARVRPDVCSYSCGAGAVPLRRGDSGRSQSYGLRARCGARCRGPSGFCGCGTN